MPTQNANELDFLGLDSKVSSTKMEFYRHIITIDEPIGEPSEYRTVTTTLMNTQPGDIVEFIISTEGGNVASAMQIVEAMRMCQAEITVTVVGPCYSAGTLIALNAHSVRICDNAEFMLHSATWGVWGSSHNVKKQNDFIYKQMCALVDDTYEGFLSPKEIESLKKGEEFWFDSKESRVRLAKRMKVISDRLKKSHEGV